MKFWIAPWLISTIAARIESGSRMYRQVRITSCQKLPSDLPLRPTMPRIRAIATVIPTAADAKFWTVSPAIWLK